MKKFKLVKTFSPWVIAFIYLVFGLSWILFSDRMLLSWSSDPQYLTMMQSFKGYLFVILSSVLIFLLVLKNNSLVNRTIQKLDKSRSKFESTFEQAPMGIAHHYADESWLEVNTTLCQMLGYSDKKEIEQLAFRDFIHSDDLEEGRELDRQLITGQRAYYQKEKTYIRKDGSTFPGLVTKAAVISENKEETYLVAMLEDISSRKKTTLQLEKSLNEKKVLLSEIHHRVLNNLALISALMNLQSMYEESESLPEALQKSQVRIKCLAMIHESYSVVEESANIDFGAYLEQLISYFEVRVCDMPPGTFQIDKELESVSLNINLAVPVALLCTEILIQVCNVVNERKFDAAPVLFLQGNQEQITLGFRFKHPEYWAWFDTEKQDEGLSPMIVRTLKNQIYGSLRVNEHADYTEVVLRFENRELKGPSNSLI